MRHIDFALWTIIFLVFFLGPTCHSQLFLSNLQYFEPDGAERILLKNLSDKSLTLYLDKIKTETLLDYGVYQIEADGLELFDKVQGDRDSIMGLPIKEIQNYINQYKK